MADGIQGYSYPLPERIGETLSHRHKNCPASNGECDNKQRLRLTRTNRSTVLWICHHCGSKGALRSFSFSPGNAAQEPVNKGVAIPLTATYSLPAVAEEWLGKWGICPVRAKGYGIAWDQANSGLVIPMLSFETGKAIGHQTRLMGESTNTRYLSSLNGYKGLVGIKRSSETCYLLEDWMSTIRIAETGYSAVCLMGTSLSKQQLLELVHTNYSLYVIWLDMDNTIVKGAARKLQKHLQLFGKDCTIVLREREEPKRLQQEELVHYCNSISSR